ncbi:MAG: glycosyltransferase [Planctomycetota bacterium]
MGTERFSFARLVRAVDDAAPTLDDAVFGQIGASDHEPENFEFERLVPFDRMRGLIESADRVVCHAGAGTTLLAIASGHVPIVVPRLARFGEHVDDHQLPFAEHLAERGLVLFARDEHAACEMLPLAPRRGEWRRRRTDTELADWLWDFVRRPAA